LFVCQDESSSNDTANSISSDADSGSNNSQGEPAEFKEVFMFFVCLS